MTPEPLHPQLPAKPLSRSGAGSLGRSIGVGSLVVALLVGIQLGAIPWRYRRQIWQLQGFVLGAFVGYGLGRMLAAAPEADASDRKPPQLPRN